MRTARFLLLTAVSAVTVGTATTVAAAPAPPASAAAPAGAPAAVPADDGATVTAEEQLDERTYDLTVSSPALGQSVKVRVLVPDGWSRDAARTWPVVYAYHGGRDTYVSWTRSTDIEELSARHDVMVVMPECADGAFTDWWNYGRGGTPRWETFHTQEVLQLMERNYRAGTTRAAMGISSGATGATTYAARHPGMFRYAAASSGIQHMTRPGVPTAVMFTQAFFTDTGDPLRVWGVPGIDDANWRAHDPYELAANLRGTGLYVSSGTTGLPGEYDDPAPWERLIVQSQEVLTGVTSRDFIDRLRALGIPVTSHIYGNGWHDWATWQSEMHRYWPLMMTALGVAG
ncbi:alpha/beta hydrolase-fold protein [Actinomadura sp. NPDC047616]|uniref:alpha/beta hydrolase n=1 Tax=Actinomadura sp. NPDC047616 TaxID=3155914 RepID=UPI0033E6AF03